MIDHLSQPILLACLVSFTRCWWPLSDDRAKVLTTFCPCCIFTEHETKGGDSNGGAGRESDESDEEEVNESSEGGEEDSASSESSSESAEDTDVDEEAVTLNVPRRTASWPVVNGSIVNGIVNGSIVNGSTVNGSTRLQPSPQQQTIQPETVDTNQASKRPEPGRCRYGDDCYRQNCHYWHPWQELEYERFMAAWRQLARCRFGNNCCSAECTYWHPRQDDAFLKFVTHCLASFMTAPLAPLSSRPAHSAKSCPITLKDTAFESNKTTETKRVRQAWASPSFHNKCHSSSVSHRR